jgi:hypothetical protein
MTLHLLALVAVVLLAAGTVAAMVAEFGPLCPCGCGNPWRDHSPLRRFR